MGRIRKKRRKIRLKYIGKRKGERDREGGKGEKEGGDCCEG